MDLSIIIVTWNNEQEIVGCIDSLQRTIKYHSFEIVVVDNDSKDRTTDIIRNLYPTVKLLDVGKNLGFAKANNFALARTFGDYILFLNPDTIMQENTIDGCLDFYKEKNEYGALSCRLLNLDGSIQPSIYKLPGYIGFFVETFDLQNRFLETVGRMLGYAYDYSHEIECCMGAFVMMKRSEALQIGGFSENYFMYMEDGDLCWKIKYELHKPIYFLHNFACTHLGGCSERKDVKKSKVSKMMDSITMFWQLRDNEKWRTMLKYYRTVYGIKLLLAKIMYLCGTANYASVIENCHLARRILKEKLREACV